MAVPKIAIIIGSTRDGRFGEKPAKWILELANARGDAAYEIVDIRDYPLPFFDEGVPPTYALPQNEVAQRFASKIAGFDSFIFITAEYNHGIPAVLKNALDHVYQAFNRKPAAFVGYGGVGAARAVEQLRLNLIELQIAPLRNAVHIGMVEFLGLLNQEKVFSDFPHLEASAKDMLDDLFWWTEALMVARNTG
ncbi:NADPH-dependent FMN reductase [Roseibium sp. M-1]